MSRQSPDTLSPAQRRLTGVAIAGLGLLYASLVRTYPELVRTPAWVAYTAASCFVLAGFAVFIQASISRRAYAWMMVALLGLMTVVPAWIAFGPGERICSARTLPVGETGCRVAFGFGTLIMLGVVALAVSLARKTTSAD
jgi:hypothetical protein